MLSLQKVQKKFPEALEVERGHGAAYVVTCWKYHRGGGEGQMEINAESGYFHCHNCSHKGNIYREFPDHFDEMDDYFPWIKIKPGAISSAPQAKVRINRGGPMWSDTVEAPGETIPFGVLPDDHVAVEYLRGRGFDIDELRKFSADRDIRGLYYCSRSSRSVADGAGTIAGRIIFPIYSEELVSVGGNTSPQLAPVIKGWQARQVEKIEKLGDGTEIKKVWHGLVWKTFRRTGDGYWGDKHVPKIYTLPGFKKTAALGGLFHAKGVPDVAVVEGPLDYYKTGRHCVFTMGKGLSKDQTRLLLANWERVFYIRDPEINPNEEKFKLMIESLHPLKVHHLSLSEGRDPGACSRSEIWKQISDFVGEPELNRYGKNE
jgi:hypothetical protein